MRIDLESESEQRTLLRFDVRGLTPPVEEALLVLTCVSDVASPGGWGGTVWTASGPWEETAVTWENQPTLVESVWSLSSRISCASQDTLIEYDVTSVVRGNGTYDFMLTSSSSDGMTFHSQEATSGEPLLAINPPPPSQ